MRPRLRLLRLAHIRVKFAIQRVFRRPFTPPAYLSPDMDDDVELLRACENFLGARGGNAAQREAYKARAMSDLIADDSVPEKEKARFRAALKEMHPKLIPELQTEEFEPQPTSSNGGSASETVEPPTSRWPVGLRGAKRAAASAN